MSNSKARLAIINELSYSPGDRRHMIVLIEEALEAMGVEIVHITKASGYVPADAVFVHIDQSIISPEARALALRYPAAINAYATDIRKFRYIDGLLGRDDSWDGPVIVKSNLNYAGMPERNAARQQGPIARRLLSRVANRLHRQSKYTIQSKEDYRIYPTLSDVPRHYFRNDYVVQKFMAENDGEKNVLREYIFLGDLHYQNIERSDKLIITEDEHVSCEPFEPHPHLLATRRKLGLDYGKIDYTLINGEPFIFDANKTLGLGEYGDSEWLADDVAKMLRAFAGEVFRLVTAQKSVPKPDAQFLEVG
tara:strand:- start:1272 stop:2192 length:921 start_codon:yes stop_codon:yes gene_type:complete